MVRGGTKDYHGGAYEFNRNDKYAARDAFQFTRPIPDRDSLKTPYRYNNFGYNFGGPFFIPKLYPHNKSKTFFFWSEECGASGSPACSPAPIWCPRPTSGKASSPPPSR